MLRGQRIAVVVPAHNERAHIAGVLSSMPSFVDEVIVVDDGSDDGTDELARARSEQRVTVLRHADRQGVGAALRTGYQLAFERSASVAAVMAGDAQMDPADLAAVLAPALEGRAGYVKGNRLTHPGVGTAMPRLRRWGNRALSVLTRLATGLDVEDTQCGYTALARSAYQQVPWTRLWRGYGYPNDLLGWLAIARVAVCDVPVRPIYGDEVSGIGFRHALCVIPGLLARVLARRMLAAVGGHFSLASRPCPPRDRCRLDS